MSARSLVIPALALLGVLSGCHALPTRTPNPVPVPAPVPVPVPVPVPGRPASQAPAPSAADATPPAPAESPPSAAAGDARTGQATAPPNSVAAAVPDCPPEASASRPAVKEKPKPPARPVVSAQLPAQAPARADRRVESEPMQVAVASVLGRKVEDSHGDDVGRVVDVLADAEGRVRLAIIEYGGFLGVGNRRVAIDWSLLRFAPDEDRPLSLGVSLKTLQQAPEYKSTPRPMALTVPSKDAQ